MEKRAVEIQCAYCEKTFTAPADQNRQYCSHSCHNKAQSEHFAAVASEELSKVTARINDKQALAEHVCIYCGKPLGKGKQMYCDLTCKRRYCRITTLDERRKNREIIETVRLHPEKKCAYCGKMFTSPSHENRVYCSAFCSEEATSEYWAEVAEEKARKTSERLHRVLTQGECICIYCGEQLQNNDGGRLFCSKKCLAAFHGRRKPHGLTPRKIVNIVSNPETECAYCGKMFVAHVRDNRKYCSVACKGKAQTYKMRGGRAAAPSPELRKDAARLYSEGLSAYKISKKLNISRGTAINWIYRKPESVFSKPYFRYILVNSAEEWCQVLRDEMRRNNFEYGGIILPEKPVRLICESVRIDKSVNSLAAIAAGKGFNVFDGGYYAFRSSVGNIIKYIWRSDYGFLMTQWQLEYGRFVWPYERLGDVAILTAQEFEFILKGSCRPRFTDKIIV